MIAYTIILRSKGGFLDMATKIGTVKDLPKGDMSIVRTGDREILLVNTGTGIFAMGVRCIHGGCNLLHGRLEGKNIRCLCHGSVFMVATGEVLEGPAMEPQPTFAVKIENGDIILPP